MRLKKLLSIFLLLPIFPLISVPGDPNDSGDPNNQNDSDLNNNKNENNTGENPGGKDTGENPGEEDDEKLYTKKDLTQLVEKRFVRERKKIAKEVESEFAANKAKEEMTENEKLRFEKEETEKKAAEIIAKANERFIKSEVKNIALELNIIDGDGAYQMMDKSNIEVNEDGKVEGVREALEDLIKTKTYLVKSGDPNLSVGDDQQGKDTRTSKFDMNSLIRKAAGR